MTKQTVNVGTSANDRSGDSLRTAFQKINTNFTEIYDALGLNESPLNLGAFEFTGSTLSTSDSSDITIDQNVNISSNLTVGGDIIPSTDGGVDLGSPDKKFRSLYVSNETVYFNDIALSVRNDGTLLINNQVAATPGGALTWDSVTGKPTFAPVATSGDYADLSNKPTIFNGDYNNLSNLPSLSAVALSGDYGDLSNPPTIPADIGDLTDTGNLLFDGNYASLSNKPTIPTLGNFSFSANNITASSGAAPILLKIFGGDAGDPPALISREWSFNTNGSITFPDGTIQTTAFTGTVEADTLDSVTDRNAATTNNITVGAVITTDINNKLSAATGNIVTNVRHWESAGASLYIWFDAASKPDVKAIGDFGDITGWTVSVSDGNSATVTATNPAGYFSISTSVALTGSGTLTFTSPDYVAPQPLPIDINVGANTWQFGDNGNLTLPSGFVTSNAVTGVNLRSGYDVSIISNHMNVDREWIFDSYGDLTVPGGIKSESAINIDINLSDSTLRRWTFTEGGDLMFPDGTVQSTAYTGSGGDNPFDQDLNTTDSPNFVNLGLAGTAGAGYATLSITTDRDFYIGLNDTTTGAKTFQFERDGSFLLEGSIYVDGNIYGGAGNRLYLSGDEGEGSPNINIPNSINGASTPIAIDNQFGGGIQIQTSTGNWLFDDNRFLHFPSSGADDYNIGESVDGFNIRSDVTFGIATNFTTDAKYWTFDTDGNLTVPGNIKSEDDISIIITSPDSTSYTWNFNQLGLIEIPDSNNQLAGYIGDNKGEGGIGIEPVAGGYVELTNSDQSAGIFVEGSAASTSVDLQVGIYHNGGGGLEFYGDGNAAFIKNLSVTGNTIVNGNLQVAGDIRSETKINIDINLADSTLRRWTFEEDGELTLPADGTIKVTNGNLSLSAENYIIIDVTGNGQINIGNDNTNGTPILLGNKTYGGTIDVYGDLRINTGVIERFSSLSGATGVVTHDCANGHIFYHTTPSANWTVNLTNLGIILSHATAVTIVIEQGGTGYYPNAVQVAGNAVPLVWQGGTNPTPSSNRIDVVTFSILYNGLYTVLGQLTGF